MRFDNLKIKTTITVSVLLDKLRTNRENHQRILQEARTGYVTRAKAILMEKMAELESGKLRDLSVHLAPPMDCTAVYDTAISMLEMTTAREVELQPAEFRNLVQDDWDWSAQFFGLNKLYSMTAAQQSTERGYE